MAREYASSMKAIRNRNINERLQNTIGEQELNKMFSPVIKANESVSPTITKELTPLKSDLEALTYSIKEQTREKKLIKIKKEEEEEGDGGAGGDDKHKQKKVLAAYYLVGERKGKDTVYGIHVNSEGKLQMGTKRVFIQNNNIIVGNTMYEATEGLWSLVMDSRPKSSLYSTKDVANYKALLNQTGVVFEPYTDGARGRPRTLTKWKRTIEPLVRDSDFFQGEGICSQQPQKQIAFLPGDVQGLMGKLKVLLAEFLAGNKTRRNEIVGILDEAT